MLGDQREKIEIKSSDATRKIVPFFSNSDNVHCQQACVKSVLKYFIPDKEFSDAEIDENTAQTGGFTWFPPTVVFLDKVGLSVQLYSPPEFDYREFAEHGKEYIESKTNPEHMQNQQANGAFLKIDAVQEATKKMLEKGLQKAEKIGIETLSGKLEDNKVLAIGKTMQPWLSGIYELRNPHYALIIKSYSQTKWRIHDPGPPSFENKKVDKIIRGKTVFPEVLLIAR